jgi:predicted RNA-binding protein YlqC (UPF0109 family)
MPRIVIHGLLVAITTALVDQPDLVSVTVIASERGFNFDIQVAESDLGKVIGRQGRTARSIRNIVGAVAMKLKTTAHVNIVTLPVR